MCVEIGCARCRMVVVDEEKLTSDEVAKWVEESDFNTLRRRIEDCSHSTKVQLLEWALEVQRDPMIIKSNYPAKAKWAVAIIGTLAPEEFEDEPT